ncbi:MAG: hypothetical protein ACOX3T_00940 [Bdellovibrionota bacterium]
MVNGKKTKLPIRFFYELFLLLLFTLLLANITIKDTQKYYLVFLDNSFSTKAKISKYKTYFDDIKDSAISLVESFPKKAKIKILSSDTIINSNFVNKNDAINIINKAESSFTKDNLENYNFSIGKFDKIYIFTDKYATNISDNISNNISEYINDNPKNIIEIFSSNKNISPCNIAITNFNLVEDRAFATVSSFCSTPSKISLSLSCQNKKLSTKKLLIQPQKSITENIKLTSFPFDENKYALCKATISARNDIIKEDNEAFFIYNKNASNVYLVSDSPILKSDLETLPFNIISISKDEINNLKRNDIIIFDNSKVLDLPNSSAIIMSLKEGSLFFDKKIKDKLSITSALKGHPLLSYINQININKDEYVSLKSKDDYYLENILKSNKSLVLGTLKSNNLKYIISGFSYLPFKNAPLEEKILFLNSIKYLNANILNDTFKTLPYSYKDSKTKETISIKSTGFFKINNIHEAFNFFDLRESNVLKDNEFKLNIINKKSKESFLNDSKIYDKLLLLLIFLVFLEIAYFMFKNKKL